MTVGANANAVEVGAATWTVTEACDGTHIDVKKGKVNAQGRQGSRTLSAGHSWIEHCHAASFPSYFCQAIDADPGSEFYYFIFVTTPQSEPGYQLCLTGNGRAPACQSRPFHRLRDRDRVSDVQCLLNEKPGTYTAHWVLRGEQVGIALQFLQIQPVSALGPMSNCFDNTSG